MKRIAKSRKWLSWLIVIEIVMCYMAILTVVSYLRGPVRHQIMWETPLLEIADFTSFLGESADSDKGLLFKKGNEEGDIGYKAHLELSGLTGVYVAFSVDCPEEYAGNILHIDLQESSVGYDNDDQEFFCHLKEGLNQVEFSLDPGDFPPKNVLLRFFTLEPANYIVQNLKIYPEIALPKTTGGMMFITGMWFVLLLVTLTFWYFKKKEDNSLLEPITASTCGGSDPDYGEPDFSVLSSKGDCAEVESLPLDTKQEKSVVVSMGDEHITPQLSISDWRMRGITGWIMNPLLQRVACQLNSVLEQQLGRVQQLLDAQQILLEQMKAELNISRSKDQYFSDTLADQSFHLMQTAEKLTTLQNQSLYCAETLGIHGFRLTQAEEKLEKVQNQGTYNSEILGDHSFRLTQTKQKLEALQNQSAYNSETLRSQNFRLTQAEEKVALQIGELRTQQDTLKELENKTQKLQEALLREISAASKEAASCFAQCERQIESRYEEIQREMGQIDRQLDAFSASAAKAILVYKSEKGLPMDKPVTQLTETPKDASERDIYTVLDYFQFQNHFRGTRAQIAERQSIYLPYFKNCQEPVLDLGCGRGEFLHILKEANVPALGVDLYPEYQIEGELNGLDIRQGDGIAFLQNTDMQFGGIFAAQLIEHISFAQLQTLCQSAFEKLVPGGCLILETPNPTCLAIYTNSFYIDPTHRRPVHPLLLTYVLQEIGFRDVQTVYTEASRTEKNLPQIVGDGIRNLEEVNQAINCVSELLYGSQDYAVIAKK